jgi:hypothetical protein
MHIKTVMMEQDGWMAALKSPDKEGMVDIVSLVAWATCCNGDEEPFITGLIPSGAKVIPCTEEPLFIRYISPQEELIGK